MVRGLRRLLRISGDGKRFEKTITKGFGKRPKAFTRCEWQLRCFMKKYGKSFEIVGGIFRYRDAKKKTDKRSGSNMLLMIVRRIK